MGAVKKTRTWGKELCSSIGINGVREGDNFTIDVFQERLKSFKLNRTRYTLATGEKSDVDYIKSKIVLPVFGAHEAIYELELVMDGQAREHNSNSRYLLKSISESPFRLNGVYTFEAFLERGDIVEIGFNQIRFLKKESKNVENKKMLLTENIVKSSMSILIEGETGTGKTTLARAIHEESNRSGRFVHLNLSSFSPSLIESELFGHVKGAFTGALNAKRGAILEAHKGTLFLDEIDSLTIDLQTKLLLFLDSHEVRSVGGEHSIKSDVRLIFASGSNLKTRMQDEKMRKDFYYRLQAGASITLKALRNEPEKIRDFCLVFEEENAVVLGEELIEHYCRCPWPGNIRQLKAHLLKKKVTANGKRFFIDDEDRALLLEISSLKTAAIFELQSLEEMKTKYCYEVFLKLDKSIMRTSKVLELSPNTLKAYLVRQENMTKEMGA